MSYKIAAVVVTYNRLAVIKTMCSKFKESNS